MARRGARGRAAFSRCLLPQNSLRFVLGQKTPRRRDPEAVVQFQAEARFARGARESCGPVSQDNGPVMVRSAQRRRRPRRDRHGRGLRGLLYPSDLPAARSRAERFDALVLEALEPIEARWRTELTDLDVAVDDVPDLRLNPDQTVVWEDGVLEDRDVPLARLVPAGVDRRGQPTRARIVVYRRPLEVRARDGADLADLVHDVLVEQVAAYLGLDPDVVEGEG